MIGPAGDDIEMPPGPYVRRSPLVALLTVVALALTAGLAWAAAGAMRGISFGDDCEDVPGSTVGAIDSVISVPLPQATGPVVAVGHNWAGLQQVGIPRSPKARYVAGYVVANYDGNTTGPAAWLVVSRDSNDPSDLSVNPANEAARTLTPSAPFSAGPSPQLTKALECTREALRR